MHARGQRYRSDVGGADAAFGQRTRAETLSAHRDDMLEGAPRLPGRQVGDRSAFAVIISARRPNGGVGR